MNTRRDFLYSTFAVTAFGLFQKPWRCHYPPEGSLDGPDPYLFWSGPYRNRMGAENEGARYCWGAGGWTSWLDAGISALSLPLFYLQALGVAGAARTPLNARPTVMVDGSDEPVPNPYARSFRYHWWFVMADLHLKLAVATAASLGVGSGAYSARFALLFFNAAYAANCAYWFFVRPDLACNLAGLTNVQQTATVGRVWTCLMVGAVYVVPDGDGAAKDWLAVVWLVGIFLVVVGGFPWYFVQRRRFFAVVPADQFEVGRSPPKRRPDPCIRLCGECQLLCSRAVC